MALKGSKTENNLKEAFAGESQANRRYLYFAQKQMSKDTMMLRQYLDLLQKVKLGTHMVILSF